MAITFFAPPEALLTASAALIWASEEGQFQLDHLSLTNNHPTDSVTVTLWRVADGAAPNDGNVVLRSEPIAANRTLKLNFAGSTLNQGQGYYGMGSIAGVATAALSGRVKT